MAADGVPSSICHLEGNIEQPVVEPPRPDATRSAGVKGQRGADSTQIEREEVGRGGRAELLQRALQEMKKERAGGGGGRREGGGRESEKSKKRVWALTVGVVCGGGCGVVSCRSGVGIVTPIVTGVADHPGHPGAPRRRLQ
jgi:hypothetical protein